MTRVTNSLNYIELPSKNLQLTKQFFSRAFGWEFTDYGPEYCCFLNVGIDGGFYLSEMNFTVEKGAPLLVIYAENLALAQQNVEQAEGLISKPIFSFPGGQRFHFIDLTGNEFAVWSL